MPPFSQKVSGAKNGHDRFLATLIHHRQPYAPLLDVHDAIGGLALREDGLLFSELLNPSRCSDRFEKHLCVEGASLLRFHA